MHSILVQLGARPAGMRFGPAWRRILFAGALLAGSGIVRAAEATPEKSQPRPDFMPAIQLAPFVVNGEKLTISILARSKSDRRYAEKFAEDVIEVVYATLEKSPGAGLVIIGEEGEPHPVFVFRKFVEMAQANQLDSTALAAAREVDDMMKKWEARMHINDEGAMELPLDAIIKALPVPLEGVASKLYQLAWAERFDEKRVEEKLRSLTAADLASNELSRYDWVFYLPPRGAFNEALKTLLPVVLKKEKVGLFKRAAVRSALVVFKPAIKKAVEGASKGMMFMTVFRARSSYSEDDIMALTRAYVRVMMPDFKFNDSTAPQRAIEAVEAQKLANVEYAKDPFVSPTRLAEFDSTAYVKFEGEYAEKKETTHRFVRNGDAFTWQYLDWPPAPFFPAGDRRFVSENGTMTLEFLVDGTGAVTGVEERWVRRRKTVPRKTVALAPAK